MGQKTIDFSIYLTKYKDASLAFFKALEACRVEKADKLIIPKGTYNCHAQRAFQKYYAISNNENGCKGIALPIIDQHNLEIDGQGSRIILHDMMMSSVVEKSTNIVIKNLEFDWDKPFYAQGKVISKDTVNKTFDLKFEDYVEYRIVKNDILFNSHGREYMISQNFWLDPEIGPVHNLVNIRPKHWDSKSDKNYQIEDLGEKTIRVKNQIEQLPEVGWSFIAKWRNKLYRVNRSAPGIYLRNSFNITLDEVKVFSTAGMGIIGEHSGDITLNKVQVIPTPGTSRVVSSTADATHFANCKGKIVLKDCVFENHLDDGLNIHGNYAVADRMIDKYTLACKIKHRQQLGYEFAEPGDTIQVINQNTLIPTGEKLVVKNIHIVNGAYFEIETQEPMKNISSGMGLDNITWSADLEMTGCSVGKNWARSILVKTPGKSVVTNNKFYSSMQGIRNWGDMIWFYESGSVTDVLISDNQFIDLCKVGAGYPVIVIYPQAKEPQLDPPGYYNRNIRIVNNTIKTFDRGILYAFSVDGLTFENNTIIRTDTFEPLSPELPVIQIEHCKDINISHNTYEGGPEADIVIDDLSKKTLTVKNNKGFSHDIRKN